MKNIFTSVVACLMVTFLSANISYDVVKSPISEERVPTDVVSTFKKDHKVVEESKWYPYPYRFSTENTNQNKNWYYSVVNLHDKPDFYEVEFNENGEVVRKIYDANGNFKMVSHVKANKNSWSPKIKNQLAGPAYKDWKVASYEVLKKGTYNVQTFHKVLMTNGDLTKVVYFDNDAQISKSREWEVSMEKIDDKNVYLKTAYAGNRARVEVKDLTWMVRMKIKESLSNVKIIELIEAEPVHIPQQRKELEYYDMSLSPTYQVVFKDKRVLKKNTYNGQGELLETVELINSVDLPTFVKNKVSKDRFSNWGFEENAEKVLLENGSTCYRLHADVNGQQHVFVVYQD